MTMRSFETQTKIQVDIQPSSDLSKLLLVFDGECFPLTGADARRLAECLKEKVAELKP
jgi:hypothetical protein